MSSSMEVDDEYDKLFKQYRKIEERNITPKLSTNDENWNKAKKITNMYNNKKTQRYQNMVQEINRDKWNDNNITNRFKKLKLDNNINTKHIEQQESFCLLLETMKDNKYSWKPGIKESNEENNEGINISSKKKAILYHYNQLYNNEIKQDFFYKPNLKLWIHQKQGINFMISRENDKDKIDCYGGMQCDEPGMGKTLQMLELIRKISLKRIKLLHNRFNGPTIIISSSLIIEYWIEFIEKNYPKNSFEILILTENNDHDNYMFYDIIFASYHLVSSSFKYFNGESDEYDDHTCQKYKWLFSVDFLRILCDESDFIVNKNTQFFKSIQSINAKHRWYITGTPLRNTINDTKTALKFIGINEKRYTTLNDIKSLIKIVMIRRLKTDKDVFLFKDMKDQKKEHYECHVDIKFIDFYDKSEERVYNIYKKKLKNNKENHIFSTITKTRQACINPIIIDELELPDNLFKINYFYKNDCKEELKYKNKNEKLIPFIKKKSLFNDSIDEYLECLSILNKEYTESKDEYKKLIKNSEKYGYNLLPKFSTKGRKIVKYIQNTPKEDKIVIYYESIKALKQLSYELNECNINYILISGENKDLKERSLLLRNFKSIPKIKVLLMTKICNQGISLVCASHIIIVAPGWSPWGDIQAIHRLYRPGQTKNVKVLYFIIKNTIEEYIMRLSFSKLELTNNITKEDNYEDNTIRIKFDDFLKLKNNKSDEEFKLKLIESFIK